MISSNIDYDITILTYKKEILQKQQEIFKKDIEILTLEIQLVEKYKESQHPTLFYSF